MEYGSVGRALDCRAKGTVFDSRDRTNAQGLKITENGGAAFEYTARPSHGSVDQVKWRVPSPVADVKTVISIVLSC